MKLLPQEMAPVTPQMQALTDRYLSPHINALTDALRALRHAVDAQLKPAMPEYFGKPYPIGRCEPIARVALNLLPETMRSATDPGMVALRDFLLAGGEIRSIWGILRGRYFQNALQIGALYVDVGNDTVDPKKPQIEILPLAESGMESVRDIAHCATIAASYWETEVYANHVIPSLAPLLPLLTAPPNQPAAPQLACDYMIALSMRDGFRDAEAWLASRPSPPDHVAERLRAATPAHLLSPSLALGREQALAACTTARAQNRHLDMAWRDARVRDYLSIRL
ncbi:hypothetical protein [Ferrovibrio sp.]|uniref:hypothetical protein n=1 Tax=Ferrovibrio sp. TaxID=1917215 RepID=UPI0035B2DC8B